MEFTVISLTFFVMMDVSQSKISNTCDFDNRCQCWTDINLLHVNCSRGNITTVPHFPSNIKFLNLQHNFIQTIPNRALENLGRLEELDLSLNQLTHLQSGSFIGLRNLQRLILQKNTLDYNIKAFPKEIFKPLISLAHLDIKFNSNVSRIDHFPDEVIADLITLKSLEMDAFSSAFYATPFGKGFSALTNLKQLKTGYCIMFNLTEFTFSNMKYLEFIDISKCRLFMYHTCTLCHRTNLKYLDVSESTINMDGIYNLMLDLQSSSIETLTMANMHEIHTTLDFLVTIFWPLHNTSIHELHVNNNNLVAVYDCCIEYLEIPSKLQSLDFSNNNLVKVRYKMPYLLNLNLRNNTLGEFLATASYLRSRETPLRYIDLSFNNIHKLAFSIFHGHPRLETIDLSNNNMQDITFDLSQLSTLRMLNLSNNNILTFNHSIRNTISTLLKKSGLKIDLSNNILRCSCENMSFLRWLIDYLIHFLRSHTYKCKLDNGRVIVLNQPGQTILQLEKDCTSYTVLIVSTTSGIVAACIVVGIGLIYRYRWKLRYMYYMTRSKDRRYKRMETCEDYIYNAFLSYSDLEMDFILKDCIPNLERNGNMKLCIHHRDFLPGQEITVNIANAIHDSKKTICIITRSFLDSYYCMFEFNMARMESIYSRNGQNILFLVFYEQIHPRDLPLNMLELVQKQSYIEYPNDEQGNIVFWEKIIEAIK